MWRRLTMWVCYEKASILATVCAAAFAQTKSGTASKSKSKAPAPSLLKPASLTRRAPAEFKVKFITTKGDVVIQIHRDWAPRGADRFYNLVRYGFFTDGRPFSAWCLDSSCNSAFRPIRMTARGIRRASRTIR